MAQWLNKNFIIAALLIASVCSAQVGPSTDMKDYKDPKTHEKFRKRRLTVSAWQINQLKKGALVVRLNTNQYLIDGYKRGGLDNLAEKARLEQAAININTMRAFKENYDFSKVYFIYSNSSDSLLRGARSGIFIDTSLSVNPAITMNEDFYLLAESDYVYNSSIGFVPEDSAMHVTEGGNPSSSEFPIVVKNKFGHQLKSPFPYASARYVFTKNVPVVVVNIKGEPVKFNVQSTLNSPRGELTSSSHMINGKPMELSLPRVYTYEAMSQIVKDFNTDLISFYRKSGGLSEKSDSYQDSKPFFY